MKSSRVLIQASIFILIAFAATPSEADGKELKYWMDSAMGVGIVADGTVRHSRQFIHVSQNVVEVKQVRDITAAKCAKINNLVAFTGSTEICDAYGGIDSQLSSNTHYLPWFPDEALFMLLDHSKWGNWYFTSRLSGCDVWIADREGGFEPLTIHINANALQSDPVKNLEHKERLATRALNTFNQKYQQAYRFIQRISYDYASDPYTTSSEKEAINNYWQRYIAGTGIPHALYLTESGFFYGIYDAGAFTGAWNFVLKDLIGGGILLRIDCSVQQSSCTILQQ